MSWCDAETGTLRAACLMGAELEGGSLSGPWAIGDNGLAVGPYQEHPSYGSTAVRSSGQSAWLAIRSEYGKCLSQGDTTAAGLARIVQCAERPANPYPPDRIANAYNVIGGNGVSFDVGKIVNSGDPLSGVNIPGLQGVGQIAGAVSGISEMLAKIMDAFTNPDFLISILLVFGGFWVGVIGLFSLASKSTVVKQTASTAAMAAA